MMRMSFLLLFSILFLTQNSMAQLVEEKLNWAEKESQPKAAAKASALRQQKKMENEKKWAECSKLAKSNVSRFASVKGWVLISWLHCSRELSSDKKNADALMAPLKIVDAHPELLLAGPWRSALKEDSLQVRLMFLDLNSKSKPDETWKQIEKLIELKDRLDRSQRAKIYSVAGDILQAKAQLKGAQNFFEQSLAEQDSRPVRDKLNSLLFALNGKKPEEDIVQTDVVSETEGGFEDRFRASIKSNDLITLLDDSLAYLQQFPGGKKSKWAHDKVLEIYSSFSGRTKDEKMSLLRERALAAMEKADPGRLADWSRQLHRRADYTGSLRLAEKALEALSTSPLGSVLTYIAGRSAELSGQYDKAQKYFESYIQKYAGGDELPEVYFRLGLTDMRMNQPSSAIAAFEKLLQIKNGDRYELNARYWLARCLQMTNNPRASSVIDEILEKYPLSYYGLRLRMEKSNGVLEWPAALKTEQPPSGVVYLTSTHKKALDRAQLLSENGWIAEALAEAIEIPIPSDPQAKALLAKKLNKLELFPPVVKLVNEAVDLNPDYRALDVIRLSFPQVYKDVIAEQATRQKLSPYLVRSLIRQESAFGPRAVSSSNAFGLMQLIAPTAREVISEMGLQGIDVPTDVFLPENNIRMGTYYISKMIRLFGGNVPLGLAAYNAGPQRMQIFVDLRKEVSDQTLKASSETMDELWFDELPWYETSFYVKAILRNAILYQLIDKSSAPQPDQRRVQLGPVLWANLVLKP